MSDDTHPQYPNPTITEVICEVRFKRSGDARWSPLWVSDLYAKVKDQFSIIEPFASANLPMQLGVGIDGTPVYSPQFHYAVRYANPGRSVFIELGEDRIAINASRPYEGWEKMRADVEYAWRNIGEVVPLLSIERIGMRYINTIERVTPSETIGAWLKPTNFIPSAVLESVPGGLSVVQKQIDKHNRLQVVLSELPTPNQSPTEQNGFLLDIDLSSSMGVEAGTDQLLIELDRLHQEIWEVFKSAMGPRLERLLKGELL